MSTILHINSSVRSQGSISRQLTSEFINKWKSLNPDDVVIERDLATNGAPHLTEQVMGALFTPAANRSEAQAQDVLLADTLIVELQSADIIVIGAPMYNFSVSSTLKSWIDHVARAGTTFKYTEKGPVGLLTGKRVFIFTARGGVFTKGPTMAMDFHEPYLRAVLGFIGLTDITFIHTEGLGMGADAVTAAMTGSRETMEQLLAA